MKAFCFDGQTKLLFNYPKPKAAEDETLIRILYAGICNTDVEITKGYMGFHGVLGHEFVGIAERSDDPELVGKRVVGRIAIGCSKCEFCFHGNENHCPNRVTLGIDGKDGVFAEYATLATRNLYVVPDEVSDMQAVFAEPLAAAFRTTEKVDIEPYWDCAVIGDGKLGLLAAQMLKTQGVSPLVIGLVPEKLKIMSDLGIKTALDEDAQPCSADLVVECSGTIRGYTRATEIVRPTGVIVLKSTVAARAELTLAPLVINEITVVGSRCGPIPVALNALQNGLITTDKLVTAVYPLADAMQAFQHAQDPAAIKVLLKM